MVEILFMLNDELCKVNGSDFVISRRNMQSIYWKVENRRQIKGKRGYLDIGEC